MALAGAAGLAGSGMAMRGGGAGAAAGTIDVAGAEPAVPRLPNMPSSLQKLPVPALPRVRGSPRAPFNSYRLDHHEHDYGRATEEPRGFPSSCDDPPDEAPPGGLEQGG